MRFWVGIIFAMLYVIPLRGQANFSSEKTVAIPSDSCTQILRGYDYYAALECVLHLIDDYEDTGNEDAYYEAKYNLATIYFHLEYFREAAGIAAQVAEYFEEKNETIVAQSKILLSQCYFELGEWEKSKSVLSAFSQKKWKRQNVKTQALLDQLQIQHLILSGDTMVALKLLENNVDRCISEDLYDLYAALQYEKGLILARKKKDTEALNAFLKSKKVSDEIGNAYLKEKCLLSISDLLYRLGNPNEAYLHLSLHTQLKDSLIDLRRQETISRMITKYEAQKKQKTIFDLKGEQRATELKTRRSSLANYALMISFIAVLAAAYLIITFYQQKLSSSQIITTQKELINQQKITELKNNLQIESMQSMMKGQEWERERVAKDLHDSLGGMLSAIKLKFEALHYKGDNNVTPPEYLGLQDLLDDACQEVRNISSNLQPGALEQLGLIEALTDLINKYEKGSNIEIHFQHYGVMDHKRLDTFTALNIYRIIQELLNNSLKHAQAREIIVQLIRDPHQLTIMVEDDGIGYNMEQVKEGMGSENIRSRVHFLKAELTIDSIQGAGTTTMITIPITVQQADRT